MKRFFQKLVAFWQGKRILLSRKFIRRKGFTSGFTLIELLVAALIASLLVAVLLSFLVAVLDSDRKETAKSNAQEELQAAISYISDDLQEAIYIYGSDALAGINSQLPHKNAGATSECNDANCTPVLVFWKRFNYNPASSAKYSSTGVLGTIGCMPYSDTTNCNSTNTALNPYQTPYGRTTYTTSLVAYYLKNDSANTGTTWSNTARILRWEIKDGYVAYCSIAGRVIGDSGCPATTQARTRDGTITGTPSTNTAISPVITDTNNYFIIPSEGFNRLDLSASGTRSSLAGDWKKFKDFDLTRDKFVTLVDFMDDTAYAAAQGGGSVAATAAIKIPIGLNNPTTFSTTTTAKNTSCDDPSIGVGNVDPINTVTQRIPNQFDNSDGTNPSGLSSFYACVAPDGVSGSTARIFLRGNAMARLATPSIPRASRQPTTNNITFFPTADVRSFGRSAIGIKKK